MKKFLICIMCAIMIASSFACKNTGNETQSPEQTSAFTQAPVEESTDDVTQDPATTDEPTAEPVTVIPSSEYAFNEQTGEFEDAYISFVLPNGLSTITTSAADPIYTYSFMPDNYPDNSDSIVYIIAPASEEGDYSNKNLDEIVKELEEGFVAMEMECSIENAALDTVEYGEYNAIIFSYDITISGMTVHQILWSITTNNYSINITSTTLDDFEAHLNCLKSVKIK